MVVRRGFPSAVRAIVKERCSLAWLDGELFVRSLRSGFVAEAERQKVSFSEKMAMTRHHGVTPVMCYFLANTSALSAGRICGLKDSLCCANTSSNSDLFYLYVLKQS
jgi:hypothetical protein